MAKVKTIQSQSHEAANLLPMLNEEDRAGLKESIERHGVLDPVVMFKGKILDGRNRMQICEELNAEGKRRKVMRVLPGENGEPEEAVEEEVLYTPPIVEFQGGEQEALEFVIAKNMHRRHLNGSQKAVVAVRAFFLGKKNLIKARRKGASLSTMLNEVADVESMPSGDIANWVAKIGGTNRAYVFRVLSIAEAPGGDAYLDDIMKCKFSVNAALADIKAKESASKVEGDVADEGEKESAENAVPVVLDGRKKAVPEEFWPVFNARDDFKQVDQKLRLLANDVKALCEGEGGAYAHSTEFLSLVTSLRRLLKETQPHTVCPQCDGRGHEEGSTRKTCTLCKRAKYVSKLVYEAWQRENGDESTEEANDEAFVGEPETASP